VKRLYWTVGGIVIGVILIVVFIPGDGESLEQTILGWVGGWAS
jgi:hypothetical protein